MNFDSDVNLTAMTSTPSPSAFPSRPAESAITVLGGLMALAAERDKRLADSEVIEVLLGLAAASARRADDTLDAILGTAGSATKAAGRLGHGFADLATAIGAGSIVDGLRRLRVELADSGKAVAEDGRELVADQYDAIRDLVIEYVASDLAPRLVPPLIDDLTPHLVDETAPELIDALMPLLKEKYIPEILESVAESPVLLGAIREGSRGAANEASTSLRDHAANADDRLEASFRRLVPRRKRKSNEAKAAETP